MSIDVTVEQVIARPRAEVAAYTIDPAHEPEWIRGIVASTPITPGPLEKGSRVRRVAKFMGRRIEYTPEVLELDPGQRLLMQTDKPFPMTIEYEFADRDGGAVFRQRLTGGPSGIAGLFSPLMAIIVRRNIRGDMARLGVVLEIARSLAALPAVARACPQSPVAAYGKPAPATSTPIASMQPCVRPAEMSAAVPVAVQR